MIDARAGEPEAKRAGHGSLGPSGIGRAMSVGVSPHRLNGAVEIGIVMKQGGDREQEGGKARGRNVHRIVDLRRGKAERLVARRAVADHAVGGVDRLVGHHARQAENRAPHDRRHHGVGEILGEALDGGARHACLVERARVAADDLGNGFTPCFDPALIERIGNGGDMLIETASGR